MALLIQNLQSQLAQIYALPHTEDIRNFLIDSQMLKEFTQKEVEPETDEQILLRCHEDWNVEVALYFEEGILKNLDENHPDKALNENNLADFCTVVEGISHFLFVDFRARLGWPLTALEMELQAEIDKFVTSFIYRYHHEGSTDFSASLHQFLFERFRLKSSLDQDERERYQLASQGAARFCRHLQNRFLSGKPADKPDWPGLLNFLRNFYRQGWNAKYATISESKI